MAANAVSDPTGSANAQKTGFLTNRQKRAFRENMTAYLFLLPAALIIFTFGIFPVFYAAYVSLFKWRIKQGEFRGLGNFVNAMGDVAYVFFYIIAAALLFFAITTAINAFREARKEHIPYYFLAVSLLPGLLFAAGITQILLRCITFFTQEDAISAGHATVLGSIPTGIALTAVGVIATSLINRWQRRVAAKTEYSVLPNFAGTATGFIFATGLALMIAQFTYASVKELETSAHIYATYRIGYLFLGIGILGLAYALWQWSMNQHDNLKAILGILAAAAAIGAGFYFAAYWPIISAEADPDFYKSLLVTVYFSAGTVPVQLAIAVVLAYLLFQDIKFKGLFRVIYFIPYMAPSVAAAGIFQVIFSSRESGIANRFIGFVTNIFGEAASLRWLKESDFAIAAIGQSFGIETAANWSFGPSLALVVIILYSIWVYVGYNTVIFLAGLGNIPRSLYEAAEIDGAGSWALFRHVTLPLLSPITFFLSVLAVIGTFKAFNSIWVMRDTSALGTTDTASVFFFEEFFRGSRFGYATSMAIVLFVIILVLTAVQNRLAEGRVHYG